MKCNKGTWSVLVLLTLVGCARSYTLLTFSFPPGSAPHEGNWAYQGKILVWDPRGKNQAEKGVRKFEISIIDKDGNLLLTDKFQLESASVEREVHWDKYEELTIKLYEKGNPYATDEYNKQLVSGGMRLLTTLSYVWQGGEFRKREHRTSK